MNKFNELNLPELLTESLSDMGYETPTPIQAAAIPVALEGRDILGSAQTGSGKTAAFGIPLINHLIQNPKDCAIVLTPTRELAMQVATVMREMVGKNEGIRTALLIGGAPMRPQLKQLKGNPRIVVGTPGRINDHLDRENLRLNRTNFLVLDETDRMLDMGFGIQINDIIRHLPKIRQTLMFSATLPPTIVRMSEKYLHKPERICVDEVNKPSDNVKQEIIRLPEAEKYGALMRELDNRDGSIIVFVKTKRGADRLAFQLNKKDYNTKAIHGDLDQRRRDRVIKAFREEKVRVMVATDVVARGLDVPHVKHVINYDLPQCPEDYIHRIGRTARAGEEGESLCLVSPQDNAKWYAIDRMLNPGKPRANAKKKTRRGSPRGRSGGGNGGGRSGPGGRGGSGGRGHAGGSRKPKSSFRFKR